VQSKQGLVAAASTAAAAARASAASAAAAVRAAETTVAAAAGRTTTAATAVATATRAIATAASATTVAATAAAKAAGAWRTCLHRTGFIHYHATSAQRLAVHAVDGCLCFCIAGHFDKAKAFGATGVAFHHDFGAGNSAKLTKGLLQIFVTHRIRQVADV